VKIHYIGNNAYTRFNPFERVRAHGGGHTC